MPRPRVHDEELRDRLLERTSQIVIESGVGSLSLRTLAAAEATSTSAVYSLFGGKPGLLSALFEEAFESFGQAQRAVPVSDDPISDIGKLSIAYWDWALAHPPLFGIMFGGALAGFDPDPAQLARAATTIEPLATAVGRGLSANRLAGDPTTVTLAIWAAIHGLVSLQLANCSPYENANAGRTRDLAIAAMLRGWAPR